MKWDIVRLIDVCDFQGGSQPPKEEWLNEFRDGYIRMLQIRDFTQERDGQKEYIKITNTTKMCEESDILIARYGASVGKILTGLSGAYNVAIMKTIPDTMKLQKRYLYFFLRSDRFQNYIKNVGSRAAQAGFNKTDLEDLIIPLPPLELQRKITDVLDKAHELINSRKKQIELIDQFVKSTFIDMFGDPVANPKGWEKSDFSSIICEMCYGSSDKSSDLTGIDNKIPILRIPNVIGGKINYNELKYIEKDSLNSKLELEPGDILFVRSNGNPEYIARCAVFNSTEKFTFASYLIRVRISNSTNPEFIRCLMEVDSLREFIRKSTRTTAGNYNINTQGIKAIPIVLPPHELQNRFAAIVQQVEKQKALLTEGLENLEYNYKSLMQKAFNGELFL